MLNNFLKQKSFLKSTCLIIVLVGFSLKTSAQIAVTVTNPTNTTPNLAISYTSLKNALTAVNAITAMSGSITLTLAAGATETETSTFGFVLGSATLNPILSATNTITIIKAAGDPTILNAGSGALATPTSSMPNGIFSIRGADFVTIDGLTFTDTNTANPATMEFGVALFKASASDGCNNNTIKNCIFNLQRINNVNGTSPMPTGATSILVINSIATDAKTALTPTNGGTLATNGTNSNNKFYGNTINNGNNGFSLTGFAATTGVGPNPDATTFLGDIGNDIGGNAESMGNSILNFGGNQALSNAATGIRLENQWSANVSYNTINNNNGSGFDNRGTTRGIDAVSGISGSVTINNNTISVKSSITSGSNRGIYNIIGATASSNTVNINNNTITNCTIIPATTSTATFIGIQNDAGATNININNNTISGFVSKSSGSYHGISNSALASSSVNINNNDIGNATNGAFEISVNSTNTNYGIRSFGVLAQNATISIADNNFQGFVHTISSQSPHRFISLVDATADGVVATIKNNTFTNLNINSSASLILINHSYAIAATGQLIIDNNAIVTGFTKASGNYVGCAITNGVPANGALIKYTDNNFSNITVTGVTRLIGFDELYTGTTAATKIITGNTFNNLTSATGSIETLRFYYWGGISEVSNNTISNLAGQSFITAINLASYMSLASSIVINKNNINNLISTGTSGAVTGIDCTNFSNGISISENTIHTLSSNSNSGSTIGIAIDSNRNNYMPDVSRNKIYNLSGTNTSTTVVAIYVYEGTGVNIINNLIADLKAPASEYFNAINGIFVYGTNCNVYYNTIHLNATSTSATVFGSSCITFQNSGVLDLRNNILVNTSTAGPTAGFTACLRRFSGTEGTVPSNYKLTSNNNLFWVNPAVDSLKKMTYVENTSSTVSVNLKNTFAEMKTFMVDRDQNSVTENISFVSTDGANVNFLIPSGTNQAESGAVAISGLENDFKQTNIRTGYPLANQSNGGGLYPDIGALEADLGCITNYDGTSWNKGTPTTAKAASFSGNYTLATDLSARSLAINETAVVNVPSGLNFIVNGKVKVASTANLTFENNANLIQVDDVVNKGKITIKRNTAALKHLDYCLWSSPVLDQQLQSFSAATLANRFYTYNPVNNLYKPETATNNFAEGTGYLIRMPDNHPTTPTIWNGSFTGIPNNGNLTLSVTNDTYYSIGNPYPSTIDADDFIVANSLTEPLYFWRKTNNTAHTSYATYTLAGGVANAGGLSSIVPNGTIQVGQGFIAKSANTEFVFTNSLRTSNNANQFLRTKAIEKHRIWLSLSKNNEAINQTMIAYMKGATSGIDKALDGKIFNNIPIALTSFIENEEFVIQAKGLPFEDTDRVRLIFKTNLDGNYSIVIDQVDGLFLGNQEVFLNDKVEGKIQNLKNGSYVFESAKGIFNSRFELVFKNTNTLNNNSPEFETNSIIVYKQNGLLNVNAGKTILKKVVIYDILGKKLFEKQNINQTSTSIKGFEGNSQTILVKIVDKNNNEITKKFIY